MRTIIQRVLEASVTVDGSIISSIGPGLVCLIGIHESDSAADADFIISKIMGAKLFEDDHRRPWRQSVVAKGHGVLLVSQFTLYGTVGKKGSTDFHHAMGPEPAREMYAAFVAKAREAYAAKAPHATDAVRDGEFGALMRVALVNDGPVTLEIDSIPARAAAAPTPPATAISSGAPSPDAAALPAVPARSWPALVGTDGEVAIATIRAERPDLPAKNVQTVPQGAMVTMDVREDRVRVFVGEDGKVARAPRIG